MIQFRLLTVIAFTAFSIWIFYLAGTGQRSIFFDLVAALPYGDKLGHLCLFGSLTGVFNYGFGYRQVSIGHRQLLVGTLCMAALMSLEELSQINLINRTFDIGDYIANMVGIVIANRFARHVMDNEI